MTDKSFCEPSLSSSANNWDDLLTYWTIVGGVMKKYAYFVTTYQSTTDVSYTTGTGWALNYLKCKYYAYYSIIAYFYYGDTSIQIATNNFDGSACYSPNSLTPSTLMYLSQSHYNNNGTDITYVMEIDITSTYNSLTNFNFRNGDAMVLQFTFANDNWNTIYNCTVLGGLIPTSNTQPITCQYRSSS
jgi:hypothetical protein